MESMTNLLVGGSEAATTGPILGPKRPTDPQTSKPWRLLAVACCAPFHQKTMFDFESAVGGPAATIT